MGTVCCNQKIGSYINLNRLGEKKSQKQTNPTILIFRKEKKLLKIPLKKTKVRISLILIIFYNKIIKKLD
jgi:hypothetical protein